MINPIRIGRRSLLKSASAVFVAPMVANKVLATPAPSVALQPGRWIWYPGQLAAYRHARLIRLSVERCTNVGYPANFRQPQATAYFRKQGTARRDTPVIWAGPIGRIRVQLGGVGFDITKHQGAIKAGLSDIFVQIDFAQSLPCLLLEAEGFSTDETWEASLDGKLWVPAEVSDSGGFTRLPDSEQEHIVSLPVIATLPPERKSQDGFSLSTEQDAVFDFNETELGALKFVVRGEGELTVQVGESEFEVRDPDLAAFEQLPLKSIALTATPSTIVLPERALRFARFAVTGTAEISEVRFDAKFWPAQELGRFETSDLALNAIWKVAVATLRSNMHDFYLDGIRRDGLVWHDGPLSLEAFERVFFNADLSRQTLIAQTLPNNPSVQDFGIIDSQMYDVIGFEREYLMRGEARFSEMFRERIEDILQLYSSLQDGAGLLNAKKVKPYGFFPDWSASKTSGPDPKGAPAYGQMLLAAAFGAGARLAAAWGDEKLHTRWLAASDRLRILVRESFLDKASGLYINGIGSDGQPDVRLTSFAQAFAVMFDVATPAEYARLFSFLNDTSRRSTRWSLSQVVELTAYAKAGRVADGLARLRQAWLPMIQQGHRRFFEDINPAKDERAQLVMYSRKYGNSLCHAWAGAAPVMLLSRGVLGIEPLMPGFALCSVEPNTAGIASGYGAVPTPRGIIEVEWSGKKAQVILPVDTSAKLPSGRIVTGAGKHSFSLR